MLTGQVKEVDDPLFALQEGSMVALFIKDYDKYPVLGKVVETKNTECNVHYWKRGYRKAWAPHMEAPNTLNTVVPKSCIILNDFHLVNSKLTAPQKKFLQQKYKELTSSNDPVGEDID